MEIRTDQQAKEFIERVLVDLWPQMADLAQRDAMMRVWSGRLIGYDWEELASALQAHRSCQSSPFRPEPGDLAGILRRYGPGIEQGHVTMADCVTDVWIQCVSRVDGRGPVGVFVQMVYLHEAPAHDIVLQNAQDWAQRHARQLGGLWEVREGWSFCDMQRERIRLQSEARAVAGRG